MAQYNSAAYKLDIPYEKQKKDNDMQRAKLELIQQRKKEKSIRKAQVRDAIKLIATVAFVAVIAMGILYREVQIFEGEKQIEKLEKELRLIETQSYQKMYDLEKSTDLKQIEEYATEQLGMVKMDKNQVVNMNIEQNDYAEKTIEDTRILKRTSDMIENAFENIAGIFAAK